VGEATVIACSQRGYGRLDNNTKHEPEKQYRLHVRLHKVASSKSTGGVYWKQLRFVLAKVSLLCQIKPE
jgi:hypothetical protein